MTEKDYYSVLIKAIEDKMVQDSNKIIEEKVDSFRNNLKDIRDEAIAHTMSKIRIMSEENMNDGVVNISINYRC